MSSSASISSSVSQGSSQDHQGRVQEASTLYRNAIKSVTKDYKVSFPIKTLGPASDAVILALENYKSALKLSQNAGNDPFRSAFAQCMPASSDPVVKAVSLFMDQLQSKKSEIKREIKDLENTKAAELALKATTARIQTLQSLR